MSKELLPQAFTVRHNGLASFLICNVDVGIPMQMNVNQVEPVQNKRALWDTGATGSVISKQLAEEIGLVPVGRSLVTGVNGTFECNKYLIDVYLPNHVRVQDVFVTESSGIQHDLLIGMDIIKIGDFALTFNNGSTIFSYQFPPTHQIDFVMEINELQKRIAKNNAKNTFKQGVSRMTNKKRK